MTDFFRELGALRLLHGAFLLILILSAPFAGEVAARSGIEMWPSLIAPALVPMFFFVIPLDITMCLISKSGAATDARARYNRAIKYDLVLLALLLIAWVPFFAKLVINR
jgi:hypothetical protein